MSRSCVGVLGRLLWLLSDSRWHYGWSDVGGTGGQPIYIYTCYC